MRRGGRVIAGLVCLAAATLGASMFWWGGRGALPRAQRSSAEDPVLANQRCEGCHQEIASEWRGSQHHTSFTDPTFQAALALEPKAFCRGCHAPEDPDASREGGPHTLGIGCVTCHLAGEVVIASDQGGFSLASHRVDRSAAFGTARACAGCHQFPFDDAERRVAPLDMQRTLSEHQSSPDADKSCADCHMPRTLSGHRSHAFGSTRSDEAHRRAVVAQATRTSATSLRIALSTEGVGHAYPTGDLFRRLSIEAQVEGADHQVLSAARRYLARHFATGQDRFGEPIREELTDDRLVPGQTTVVDLALSSAAAGKPIRWSVHLERVLSVADHQAAAAVVPERVHLAGGELAP